jgi:hypothetical protein
MIGVWNEETKEMCPGSEREVAVLSRAQSLAIFMLENHGISYEGEVRIETAVLRGRDLYLGFWVDGKHYARILRDALGGEQ